MSDPRDEMRRILHRPPEGRPEQNATQGPKWLDSLLDVTQRLTIGIDNSSDSGTCLSGLMKMANDALEAAESGSDD